MQEITITNNEQDQRLDRFLRKYLPQAPLSHIYKMIRKDVKVNQKRAGEEMMLQLGDVLQLYITDEQIQAYRREVKKTGAKKQFAILYEDEHILIADKPKGLLTHGDQTEKKNTLVNQVTDYLIETGDYRPSREKTFSPAAANRLDRNTSGIVVFGKNYGAVRALARLFRERKSLRKLYVAICFGELRRELHVKSVMQKDESRNKVKAVAADETGKLMETLIRPIEVRNGFTLAEAELLTGRTHQIRVHLAESGFPIAGDPKYGNLKKNKELAAVYGIDSQCLHAYKLQFIACGEPLSYLEGKVFVSDLPPKLRAYWKQLADS